MPEEIELQKDELKYTQEVQQILENDLPTTLEIASQGKQQYVQVLQHLSPEAQKPFLRDDVRVCFSGVTPELGAQTGCPISSVAPGVLVEIKSVLATFAPDMVVIEHTYAQREREERPPMSLMNLRAGERIVRHNPDLFPPEAMDNPRLWIMQHPEEWWGRKTIKSPGVEINEARYGLLSGFPRFAAMHFAQYWKARNKLVVPADLPEADGRFLSKYAYEDLSLDPTNRERFAELLKIIGKDLTQQEKQLLINARTGLGRKAITGYIGFQGFYDDQYCTALDKIYEESDIENVQVEAQKPNSFWSRFKQGLTGNRQ